MNKYLFIVYKFGQQEPEVFAEIEASNLANAVDALDRRVVAGEL